MPVIRNKKNKVEEFINKHNGLFNLISHLETTVRCESSERNKNTDINIEIKYNEGTGDMAKRLLDTRILKEYFRRNDDDVWVSSNYHSRDYTNSIDIYKTVQND